MENKQKNNLIEIFKYRGFISNDNFESYINTNSQISFLCNKGHLCETAARYVLYGNVGCKTCQYDNKKTFLNVNLKDTDDKICNSCNEQKKRSCFGKLKSSEDGLRNTCKLCRRKKEELNHLGKIKRKESSLKYCIERPFSALLSRCKTNQNKKGFINFDITEEFLKDLYSKQNGKCFWSDLEMPIDNFGLGELNAISVDRVDSSVGYTKNNIVLCCKFYNLGKGNMDMYNFVKFLKENNLKVSSDIDYKIERFLLKTHLN